jgi:hypothetical protein
VADCVYGRPLTVLDSPVRMSHPACLSDQAAEGVDSDAAVLFAETVANFLKNIVGANTQTRESKSQTSIEEWIHNNFSPRAQIYFLSRSQSLSVRTCVCG